MKNDIEKMTKEEFMKMAGHDLRTPLTTIQILVELLQLRLKKNNDEEALAEVSSLLDAVEDLKNMVSDLFNNDKQ